ncbi:MAG: hypothetical protein JXN65_01975 [Clostridia bacterium]|nr:hypothetical protein [Clostridia bacterium]
MRKKTEKILEEIDNSLSLAEFLQNNEGQFELLTIGEYIELEIAKRGLKKEQIIRDSGIIKRYFNQIISGAKSPTRRYIIRILLSMELDLPDIQWYLKACDYNQLFVKNKRDAIIIYCVNQKLSVKECNEMLNNVGLENLGFEDIRR